MNLYLSKISHSYVKGIMRYQTGRFDPPPPVSNVVPKSLVSEGLKAAEDAADLVECGLKIIVSIPASDKTDFAHIAKVEELTGL